MSFSGAKGVSGGLSAPLRDAADLLACPVTGAPLTATDHGFATADGSRHYPVEDGIARFFAPTDRQLAAGDVTDLVRAFYEETPFPNYADGETRATLATKARANHFLRALDDAVAADAVVLEAGCGTGQLTNFLGLAEGRRVFGGDICWNSLRLAEGFRQQERITAAAFVQMNLFRPPFREASVDLVVANGVLHHTGDARAGFEALLRVVKPGGVILVGLYNHYARLATLARRRVFAHLGPAAHGLARRLGAPGPSTAQREAWLRDQYRHPHETRHSIGEVLRWFDESGVDFLGSLPRGDGAPVAAAAPLFEPQTRGTPARYLALELGLLLRGGRDGGLFLMLGHKRG